MSRKEELLKMARASLFRSRANAMSSRGANQAFRKVADYYQHEAEQLQGQAAPDLIGRSKQTPPLNRLHNYWGHTVHPASSNTSRAPNLCLKLSFKRTAIYHLMLSSVRNSRGRPINATAWKRAGVWGVAQTLTL